MTAEISRTHPLRRLFGDLVERRYGEDLHLRDTQVSGYVANMLTDFTHTDNLCRIRNAAGRRLDEGADILV
ncbi:MAG TPA: hypothetical protein VIG89_06570, partial [Candidatus Acidoferrales bacterium]